MYIYKNNSIFHPLVLLWGFPDEDGGCSPRKIRPGPCWGPPDRTSTGGLSTIDRKFGSSAGFGESPGRGDDAGPGRRDDEWSCALWGGITDFGGLDTDNGEGDGDGDSAKKRDFETVAGVDWIHDRAARLICRRTEGGRMWERTIVVPVFTLRQRVSIFGAVVCSPSRCVGRRRREYDGMR